MASLLVLVGAIKLWPMPSPEPNPDVTYSVGQDVIEVEEILPTRQAQKAPPPPAPPPPVVVPNDALLEDFDLDLTDSFIITEEPGDDDLLVDGVDGERSAAAVVEVGPKPVRFVEPEYTREARRKNVRAEVIVQVTVDARGRVEATQIVDRYVLADEGRQQVGELGYGLEEAALTAAERWLFRPASRNGEPVTSTTTLTFSFGV
jgi:protein TonB